MFDMCPYQTGPSNTTANASNAANAAAAAANLNMNPAPAPAFHLQANALPAAPPAMAVHVSLRAADRSRKQKILTAREQEVQDDRWAAEKERRRQVKELGSKRYQQLQALAAARAAATLKAEAKKVKALAQQQRAAALKVQRAAAAAAAAARSDEGAASGAAVGGATVAASSAAAGGEAAGVSGLGVGAVGAIARDKGGAGPPLTQPTSRASTRRRVPNRKSLDEVNACWYSCGFLS